MCFSCALSLYLRDEKRWIELTARRITGLRFDEVRSASHVLAAGMIVPKRIVRVGSVLFDSLTGGTIRTSSTCDRTPDSGVEQIRDFLRHAKQQGHNKATLILDGMYQFAVSIGVYVQAEKNHNLVA